MLKMGMLGSVLGVGELKVVESPLLLSGWLLWISCGPLFSSNFFKKKILFSFFLCEVEVIRVCSSMKYQRGPRNMAYFHDGLICLWK